MYSVKETAKGLVFPENIPCERGKRREISLGIMSGSLLFDTTSYTYTFLLIVEIARRCCSLLEELKHLNSRYDKRIVNLLHEVFGMPVITGGCIALSLAVLIMTSATYKFSEHNSFSFMLTLMGIQLFCKIVKLEQSPLLIRLQFKEFKGCDYGSGMAHSFFHGYLHIVLPPTPGVKGLRAFQNEYEARNKITFDCYKLIILLPMSQHCPSSLENEFSPSVEISTELEGVEIDNAGVRNRSYKNSVYKINTSNNKIKYVVAEYATPVGTLYKAMNRNTDVGRMFMKYRKELLLNFYLTLRRIIKEDDDCCNLCEIIYYNDRDESGNFRDVGQVILKRLHQIKQK